MKYRIAIQVRGAVSGLVTEDRAFAANILDKLTARPGVEWISFEASASGKFTPLEEGSAAVLPSLEEQWREAGQLDLVEELGRSEAAQAALDLDLGRVAAVALAANGRPVDSTQELAR